jgi:hypothetical protein
LRAKLLEKIDQMYADKMIDAVDVLFYKETLEHLDSTPLIHKPYLVTSHSPCHHTPRFTSGCQLSRRRLRGCAFLGVPHGEG